jgi:2-dehydro-3-deoxyglucarate aldolase/4-hydroxy-2-oxoheptanedioate aldolase
MTKNSLKDMAQSKKLKVGHFIVEFATPGIGHIMKAAGCDFGFIDMEHSGFSFETVKSALRYTQAADLPTLVRVPSRDYHHLARVCDMGAEGIMMPMVGTADDAKRIVESIKYYPDGSRGVALQIAHDDYRAGAVKDKLAAANRRTTVFALIETAEGIDNALAIAAVPGVDCLWVGHFDLSVSLGIPGEFDSPKFKKAIDKVVSAAREHGKALGRLVPNVEAGHEVYAQGFDFVCYSGDVWVLQTALADAVARLKAPPEKAAKKK